MKKLFLISLAIPVVALATHAAIGDVHTAQYKGATLCMMCHKAKNKQIVEGYQKSPHAKAMQKGDAEGAIVADFSSNTAFKKDQVAYVLGTGRNEQSYLDKDYKVLPATWDVKSKSWKPAEAVDGATQCIGCHVTGLDTAKNTCTQMGVGCEACHGPGGDHTGSPGKTTIVNPSSLTPAQKAMVCGQCHSAGHDISGKFAFPVGYRPGDDLSKYFVDAKPTSAGRNQQYSEYVTSKHSQVGVTCVTCHDPHNTSTNPAQLKKPVTELCLGCHAAKVKDMATHAPNAPAGATCATCHMPGGRHTFATPK
ncbi:MAG: multiheme c-type cytochrome [Armatimonadota bacterium]